MFRASVIIGFIAAFGMLFWAIRSGSNSFNSVGDWLRRQWLNFLNGLKTIRSGVIPGNVASLRKPVYWLTMLAFLLLAISGFTPVVLVGEHTSGLLLLLHVIVAPLFVISLTLLTLLCAHQHRFNENDWQAVKALLQRKAADSLGGSVSPNVVGQKTCFWLIIIASLPAILSILFSMYPLFATPAQDFLLQVHGYSTLLLSLGVIFHTFLITTQPDHRKSKTIK